MIKRLYLGNLALDTTEDGLLAAIGESAERVTSVSVALDPLTGRSRGFAYIDFASRVDVRAAIEALRGKEVDGRVLCVNEMHSEQRGRTRRGWDDEILSRKRSLGA